jgi:hypothetical protein
MSNCRGSEVESQSLKVECPEKKEELKRTQAVRRELRGIIMRAVVQGTGHKDSIGAAECGGRIQALAAFE